MTDILAARTQMGMSLAFHIVFAVLGIGMPVMLLLAEGLWLRTGDREYYRLARTWSKAFAILFAVGAVSGTILSFELGLLWADFMAFAGAIIGLPFALEGYAFFIEAIFLGLYLYGWSRLSPVAHWLSAFPIAVSGALSGVFVVTANAWMNTPAGFRLEDGVVVAVDPWAAMWNPAAVPEAGHMLLSAYIATGFAVAAVYAGAVLRGHTTAYNRRGLVLGMLVGGLTILPQLVWGDYLARFVAATQPAKLAAMEGQFETERGAPLRIGGIPDTERRETPYAIEIPRGLSWLAFDDPNAEVVGLNAFPPDEQPNPVIVHLSFQAMVGGGFYLLGVAAAWAVATWKRREPRWLLRLIVAAGPVAFLAIEAGWFVTEFGRQPWIIQGIMKVGPAVSEVPGLTATLIGYSLIYGFLALTLVWLLLRLAAQAPRDSTHGGQRDAGDAA
ncbi:MAG: cytochrome ubiquinol oxidase subunit I [Chloroflexi bacterium]|nr:cytochrome ubiquinol oxidase subunit I [Chloroflexota bacterium]